MAEATVTIKLSPMELRTIRAALDYYVEVQGETVKAMASSDGRAVMAQLVRAAEIATRL